MTLRNSDATVTVFRVQAGARTGAGTFPKHTEPPPVAGAKVRNMTESIVFTFLAEPF